MIKVYSLIHSTITMGREWAHPVKSFDPCLSDKFLNVFFHKPSLTPLGKTATVKKGWELVNSAYCVCYCLLNKLVRMLAYLLSLLLRAQNSPMAGWIGDGFGDAKILLYQNMDLSGCILHL